MPSKAETAGLRNIIKSTYTGSEQAYKNCGVALFGMALLMVTLYDVIISLLFPGFSLSL